MTESPFRTVGTVSHGPRGCIVFCTQKTAFLRHGKRPRMPLLVAKPTRECHFGGNRQKQIFLDCKRPQKQGLQQPRKQRSQARPSCRFAEKTPVLQNPVEQSFCASGKNWRQSLKRKPGCHQTTLLLKTCKSHPAVDAGLGPKVCSK